MVTLVAVLAFYSWDSGETPFPPSLLFASDCRHYESGMGVLFILLPRAW